MTETTQTTEFDPHALLAGRRLGVLATIKSDGRPQLSPVTPTYDRDAVDDLRVDHRGPGQDGQPAPRPAGRARGDQRRRLVVGHRRGHGDADRARAPTRTARRSQALVDYYRAAAGEHPDWDEYRAVMVSDRRVLMALAVERVYGAKIR